MPALYNDVRLVTLEINRFLLNIVLHKFKKVNEPIYWSQSITLNIPQWNYKYAVFWLKSTQVFNIWVSKPLFLPIIDLIVWWTSVDIS